MARKRLGKLPRRYRFALNPFAEVRWSRCPRCDKLTFNRKFPLFVHVDGFGPVILGKTCRYCAACEFIVAHQTELEMELGQVVTGSPQPVANDYLVMGVVERRTWQKGLSEALPIQTLLEHTADIKQYYTLTDPRPRWVLSSPDDTE
jgi:MinD superfamily P-loop ATPase